MLLAEGVGQIIEVNLLAIAIGQCRDDSKTIQVRASRSIIFRHRQSLALRTQFYADASRFFRRDVFKRPIVRRSVR